MKIESLKKNELIQYCQTLNIKTEKKNKSDLIEAIIYGADKELLVKKL
jgi:hypothetical protein